MSWYESSRVVVLKSWQTAALGLYKGLAVPLPDVENLPQKGSKDESKAGSKSPPVEEVKGEEELSKNDEGAEVKDAASRVEDGAPQSTQTKTVPQETKDWIVVLGGASSVGKYAIQVKYPGQQRSEGYTY